MLREDITDACERTLERRQTAARLTNTEMLKDGSRRKPHRYKIYISETKTFNLLSTKPLVCWI